MIIKLLNILIIPRSMFNIESNLISPSIIFRCKKDIPLSVYFEMQGALDEITLDFDLKDFRPYEGSIV